MWGRGKDGKVRVWVVEESQNYWSWKPVESAKLRLFLDRELAERWKARFQSSRLYKGKSLRVQSWIREEEVADADA